jgi:hypothetical protein
MPGTMPPPDIATGGPVDMVAIGTSHVCVVLESGAVKCWGDAGGGYAYGFPDRIGDEPNEMPPADVDYGTGNVISIDAGYAATIIAVDTPAVRCWGATSNYGVCGWGFVDILGNEPNELPTANTDYGGGELSAVFMNRYNAGVVLADGNVRIWGYDNAGILGQNDANIDILGDELPTPNLDLGGVVTMVADGASDRRACALFDDSIVRCWGEGSSGGLGNGGGANDIGDEPNEMPPEPSLVY